MCPCRSPSSPPRSTRKDWLQQRVHEPSATTLCTNAAKDVVNGELTYILGMIWRLILRFEMGVVAQDVNEAKRRLLAWCQKRTCCLDTEKGPKVVDFTSSWRDGLAFCSLVQGYFPSTKVLDLKPETSKHNLELAFSAAENLGIPRMLSIDDLCDPEEHTVMTYLSQFVRKEEELEEKQKYVAQAQSLSEWLERRISEMKDVNFDAGVKANLEALTHFKLAEEPTKATEKLAAETALAAIQKKHPQQSNPSVFPPTGLRSEDLTSKWNELLELAIAKEKAIWRQLENCEQTSALKEAQLAQLRILFREKKTIVDSYIASETAYLAWRPGINSLDTAQTELDTLADHCHKFPYVQLDVAQLQSLVDQMCCAGGATASAQVELEATLQSFSALETSAARKSSWLQQQLTGLLQCSDYVSRARQLLSWVTSSIGLATCACGTDQAAKVLLYLTTAVPPQYSEKNSLLALAEELKKISHFPARNEELSANYITQQWEQLDRVIQCLQHPQPEPAPPPAAEPIEKRGWLKKQGGTNKRLQARFFELSPVCILYSKTEFARPQGIIAISNGDFCTPCDDENIKKSKSKTTFKFNTTRKCYTLIAESEDAMFDWITKINQCIANQRSKGASFATHNFKKVGFPGHRSYACTECDLSLPEKEFTRELPLQRCPATRPRALTPPRSPSELARRLKARSATPPSPLTEKSKRGPR
eukprot:TRINITY_DN87_c0_g1_i1.p1 TRINITY_DN87_c0_g1~~TRINITY_DN87_c0_g1_i1.p1  ORF type:complete len:705 (-),score=125.47 TRINITY_DN87_c0_g1_i1:1457-3571(-)